MLIFYDEQMILQVRSPHNIHYGIGAVSPSNNVIIPLQPNHILLLPHSLAQSLPYPEIFPQDPSSLLYLRLGVWQVNLYLSVSSCPPLGGARPAQQRWGSPRLSGPRVDECCPLTPDSSLTGLNAGLRRGGLQKGSGHNLFDKKTTQPSLGHGEERWISWLD